jgi:hypothetical protein
MSFFRTIRIDKEGKCFKDCSALQTPKHLLLECRLYGEERKEMQKQLSSSLSLEKLFCIEKGREALFLFLSKTKIATRKWLMEAGPLEGGNSY